jgi:hypothetical protein
MGEFRFRPCRHDGSWAGIGARASPVGVIFLVTSNTHCTGRTEGYRLDTASARAFLGQYVTLP